MIVELISKPSMDAGLLCGMGAAICYNGTNPERSLSRAMNNGHHSVAEHAAFTFTVKGVSRVLLAQLTRHRIASYSVQSQRYCGVQVEWIVPPSIQDAGLMDDYIEQCNRCYAAYCNYILKGVPAEDARFVIPQGAACNLQLTMNARELMHFFELRCCNRAQWEIRELAWRMMVECKEVAPDLFKFAGPGCVRGSCPEGKMTCGKPYARIPINGRA